MYFAMATWMDIAGGEKDSTKPTVPLFFIEMGYAVIHYERKLELLLVCVVVG